MEAAEAEPGAGDGPVVGEGGAGDAGDHVVGHASEEAELDEAGLSGAAINLPGPGLSSNRTGLIVMRYKSLGGNQQFAAFINPASPNNPGTPIVTRTLTLSTIEIAAFRFVHAGPPGSPQATFDELGIAETYPGLIPAPGTAGLLLTAGAVATRRRR